MDQFHSERMWAWTGTILQGAAGGGRGRGHGLILQRETLTGSILQLITLVS